MKKRSHKIILIVLNFDTESFCYGDYESVITITS